jgi:hypothetical protein
VMGSDPRTTSFDHWLCRCQGFRVSSPAGPVGVVEELRFLSRVDRPDALAARAGRRLLIVPVEEVADLIPGEQRIVLRSAPPLKDRLRLLRLAAGLRRRRAGSAETPPQEAAGRPRERLHPVLRGEGRDDQAAATA